MSHKLANQLQAETFVRSWLVSMGQQKKSKSNLGPTKSWEEHSMAFSHRAVLPPYAISPDFSVIRPAYMYVPSPIVDNYGFMRECIKDRGGMIVDLSHVTGYGPVWEEKWINYINVIHSIKPWRTAGKPFVCDRLWLWTS